MTAVAPSDADKGLLARFSDAVDTTLSGAFGNLGESLAIRPGTYLLISLAITAAMCSGFTGFESESRSDRLWIPQGTQAQDDSKTYTNTFDNPFRIDWIIAEADDGEALKKTNLEKLMAIHDAVSAIEATEDADEGITLDETATLESLCFNIYTASHDHPCFIKSVLQYWNYDAATLAADVDVQATLKLAVAAEVAALADLEGFLSGFKTLESGDYTAKAAKITYFLENRQICKAGKCVDEPAEVWEGYFLDVGKACQEGMDCFRYSGRSFSDEFGAAIKGDVVLMNIGFLIIIIYLAVNLSGKDIIGSKVCLSLMSVAAVGLAIGSSMGLSQLCGWFYAPIHTVLPFVLLGLGVDDSFVIMNSFGQTNPDDDMKIRMRQAMSHAGVSITVTSMTDFVAFIISTATALPALASFCFYAATGIVFLFLYQCIFFGAFVVIDARQTAERNRCCCCLTAPPNAEQDEVRKKYDATPSMVTHFMKEKYGPWITSKGPAVTVATLALALVAIGAWGASELQVDSNQLNFIPDTSYLKTTFEENDKLFGGDDISVDLVIGNEDYFAIQKKIYDSNAAIDAVHTKAHMISTTETFESWYHGFVVYHAAGCYSLGCSNSMDADGLPNVEAEFYANLAVYLNGPGAMYSSSVVWADVETKIDILGSKIGMLYKAECGNDSDMAIEGMKELRAVVKTLGISSAYPYTFEYLTWETFVIIGNEMIMNVSLCMAAVFVITLVLIASPLTAGLVFVCVGASIIEILGAMHFWGLIIDNVSVINLTLAVGLAVDYSAHVGHCFMVKGGDNSERVILALEDIGAAVLNGAISTFLAVVALSGSNSYVFRVLFKQFFLTCVFGVFNGMMTLPVLLMWFGPAPYASAAAGHGGHKMVAVKTDVAEGL